MNIFAISKIDKNIKLNSLQYLRLIAAFSVIAFHVEGGINEKYWIIDHTLNYLLGSGVSMFFVFQVL